MKRKSVSIGALSAILSGVALVLLAILLLAMRFGITGEGADVYIWYGIFIIASACDLAGIVLGIIGLRQPKTALAVVGVALGLLYVGIVSILIILLIEFIRSITD
jgi:hypothetical protein